MKCNSCNYPINANETMITCSICNKEIHKTCAINDGGMSICDVCYVSKDQNKSSTPYTEEVPEVIRRSYIEVYKSCPYKFYMSVIKGNEMPENMYTKLGIDLHELFEKGSNERSYRKEEMLNDYRNLFMNYNEELFEDVSKKADMYTRGLDSIETFYDVINTMPEPYATEVKMEFSIGEDLPKISATFDRINLVDGELEIIDWKSGNTLVGKNHSSDLQAPIYIHAIREHYNLPVRKFTFYYLKDNKTREFIRINDSHDYECMVGKRKYLINTTDMIREVQHLFSQIKKGNFNIPIDTKKMYFACKMCHIKEMGLCQGADIQVWQQFNK